MPKRQSKLLSDLQIRHWIVAGEPVAKSDGEGLTFTLSTNGTASWVLRYRFGGRRREVLLGGYPDLTPTSARKVAAALRVRVTAGEDVAATRQRVKVEDASAWSVRTLVRDYEAKVVPTLAASTAFCTMNYLRTDLLPTFGSSIARDVSANDAQDWIASIFAERGYWAAANARKGAAAVFRYGRARRVVTGNPFLAVDMVTVAPKPITRKRIALTDEELRALLASLSSLESRDARIVELLLLTGTRIGELLSAEWVDIEFEDAEWKIPRSKIKTRKRMTADVFVVPLPAAAVAAFEHLRSLAGDSRWVLPALAGSYKDSRSMDHERALTRFKSYVETLGSRCRKITFHDLRATMRSGLSALGVRTEVAERALNHTLGGLIAIYDKNDFLAERKIALMRWAAHLDALKHGGTILPMKRRSVVA
jgi:integrase